MDLLNDKRFAALIIGLLIVLSFLSAFLIFSAGSEDPHAGPTNAVSVGVSSSPASNDLTANQPSQPIGSPIDSTSNTNATASPDVSNPQKGTVSLPELRSRVIRDGFKVMADNSQTLIGWCLAIFGATILALISTSYVRPRPKPIRLIYLLFIPGWVFIGFSVYCGNLLARYYMVAVQKSAASEQELLKSLSKSGWLIEFAYGKQLVFLQIGLIVFAIWILTFLIWWVFSEDESKEE